MAEMTVLVTGATTGIGLETAKSLAGMGAHVLVHGRSSERGRAALEEIRRVAPSAQVEFVQADLSSLSSVRGLAQEVLRRAPKLNVLINNAGAINSQRTTTADGFETTFGVNHLAHFCLTLLLLERLRASAPARIINVSSIAHRRQRMRFDDLNFERRYSIGGAYGQSKLANILFTRSLAKRLANTGVTANSLHPGVVRTGFGHNTSGWFRALISLMSNFAISSTKGARTTIYLASAPEVEKVTGEYFDKCKPDTPSPEARDDAAAERLWTMSLQMTGLTSA